VHDHMAVSITWTQTTTNFAMKTELKSKNGNNSGIAEFIRTGLMYCQSVLLVEGSHPVESNGVTHV
jgi:hypothetical protein